jgi:HPt (histidine-containing phosphotransfer) domain-containing protein
METEKNADGSGEGLDVEALTELRDAVGDDVTEQLLEGCLTDNRARIEGMHEHLDGERGDDVRDGVRQLAHALKGSVANLGMDAAVATARELEAAATADDASIDDLRDGIARLEDELDASANAVRAWLRPDS